MKVLFFSTLAISVIVVPTKVQIAPGTNQISDFTLPGHNSVFKTAELKKFTQTTSQNFEHRTTVVQNPEPQEAQVQSGRKLLDKRWTGFGIGITSLFFCIILWVLFQPDSKIKLNSTLTDQTDDQLDNKRNLTNKSQAKFEQEFSSREESTWKKDNPSQVVLSEDLKIPPQAHLIEEQKNTSQLNNSNLTISGHVPEPISNYDPSQSDSRNQDLVHKTTINNGKNITDIDVVTELIKDLQQNDYQLRRKAIWKLTLIGDSRSLRPLINIMPTANSLDKSLIISAITQISCRNFELIYDVLFSSLEDTDPDIRKDTIRDITALYESTAKITRDLSVMLNDSDQEVRETAEWAFKKINLGTLP